MKIRIPFGQLKRQDTARQKLAAQLAELDINDELQVLVLNRNDRFADSALERFGMPVTAPNRVPYSEVRELLVYIISQFLAASYVGDKCSVGLAVDLANVAGLNGFELPPAEFIALRGSRRATGVTHTSGNVS